MKAERLLEILILITKRKILGLDVSNALLISIADSYQCYLYSRNHEDIYATADSRFKLDIKASVIRGVLDYLENYTNDEIGISKEELKSFIKELVIRAHIIA